MVFGCLVLSGCIKAKMDDAFRVINPPPPTPTVSPSLKPTEPPKSPENPNHGDGNLKQEGDHGGGGKRESGGNEKGEPAKKPLAFSQLSQLGLSDLGTALKENRTNRFDAAREIRKRLLGLKGSSALPQVGEIAESVLGWITPDHPEAMQDIFDLPFVTRTFGELVDALGRRDERRYDSFVDSFQQAHQKGFKALPKTQFFEQSQYALERDQTEHVDAFLLRWILGARKSSGRPIDQGSAEALKRYISLRIKHQVNELILARSLIGENAPQFAGMAPSGLLWTLVAEGAVSHQKGQEYYAIQKDLPRPFVEEINRLFLQYQDAAALFGGVAPLWVLDQFQFLLHGINLADFKDLPRARGIFSDLIQTWVYFPTLNRDPKAVRFPLSERVWSHIRTEFSFRLDAAKTSSSERAAAEVAVNQWVDLVNTLFDSDLKSLGTDSILAVAGGGEARFEQLVRWTDERFFGVLAPYWQFQAAHPEWSHWPQHPLSRLYFYRAKLASSIRGDATAYWSWIRDFTQVPVLSDVNGELFKRDGFPALKLSPSGRTHEALDLSFEVLNHDLRRFEQEIRKIRADLKTVDVAADLPPQLALVSEYFWSLNTVEVIRMLLDEDRARKSDRNPTRDLTVRPGEASLRPMLLTETLKALHVRFGQVPQMLPIAKLFPGMEVELPHVVASGMSLRFENTHQHFNGAPGVYELSQNTELKLRSAFFHPLSILFGSTEYRPKNRWLRNGGWSPHRYLTYQAGVDVQGPPRNLEVSAEQGSVLNDPETALANYMDTVPMVAGPQVRKFCKADLPGFRPQTYDPALPLGRQVLPADAPAVNLDAQFGTLVERYNLPEWR